MSGGVNDVTIMGGIIAMFVLIGIALPYIQTDFGQTVTSNNIDGLINPNDVSEASNPVSLFNVIASIASMFFWTFGALPTWLDAVFVIVRVIFVLLLVRLARSGGG